MQFFIIQGPKASLIRRFKRSTHQLHRRDIKRARTYNIQSLLGFIPTIFYTYVSKINIFGLKMMAKSGLERIILKFLHGRNYFFFSWCEVVEQIMPRYVYRAAFNPILIIVYFSIQPYSGQNSGIILMLSVFQVSI